MNRKKTYRDVYEMAECLSLLADRYVPLDLMVEAIYLSIEDGRLRVHEVYDVFFTPRTAWPDARILGVSPHRLRENDQLSAQTCIAPGEGVEDNVHFHGMVLYSACFNAPAREFTVTLPAHTGPFDTETVDYVGRVLDPTLQMPLQIGQSSHAKQVMDMVGTVFEVVCGDLEANRTYMIRLVLDPLELLALPKRRPLDIEEIDEVVSRWMQDAYIVCPRTSYFNVTRLVEVAKNALAASQSEAQRSGGELEDSDSVDGIARVETVVTNRDLRLMPVRRHQIALILPYGAELAQRTSDGYVWFVDTYALPDGRVMTMWEAGSGQFWRDDPESIARLLYDYFQRYGSARECAKTKEEASEAINAPHDVCSLIVDGLSTAGALRDVGNGRYAVVPKGPDETERIFQSVAASERIYSDFQWKGFQIRYSLQYRYLSEEDKAHLRCIRRKRDLSYWLALVGLILAIGGLILSVVSLIR